MRNKKILVTLLCASMMAVTAGCEVNDDSSENQGGQNSIDLSSESVGDESINSSDEGGNEDSGDIEDNSSSSADDSENAQNTYSVSAKTWEEVDALSIQDKAEEFLSALCLNDTEALGIYIGGTSAGQFKNVKLDAVITDTISTSDYEMVYAVDVDVAQSDVSTFAEGKAEYTLRISNDGNGAYVSCFMPSDKAKEADYPRVSGDELGLDGYDFATAYFDVYINDGVFENSQWQNDFTAKLIHVIRHTIPSNDVNSFTVDDFNSYIAKRFGFDTIDSYAGALELLREMCAVEGDENTFNYCEHGGNVIAQSMRDVEKTDKGYSLTFDFYGDFACMYKVASCTLTFESSEGEDIAKLVDISFDKTNDTPIAYFGV